MTDVTLFEAEEKMEKVIDFAREEFANIRTGRANAAMFSKILVDYYGSPTPLQQLASFNIPEARMVLINPFDRGATQGIIRAIRDSDLGVNPTDDGQQIRVNLPILTEERRKDYVKLARSKAEEARISLRSVRHKAKDILEKMKRDGDAGEDEVVRAEKELDALTRRFVDQVDELLAGKEKDLLEI
ncbi:MAG TPA: ribosome recycling factor [Actinomycetaceae bacterium]|nr:ribosome recycling factor [Actinomycetaceae bacterium]